jgi:microcystin-dependent protein
MKSNKILAAVASGLVVSSVCALGAQAQEDYLGETFMTAASFCPRGTMEATGQLLPISANSALFSLLGTMYGGDGRTTFALPDLRSRVPRGVGQAPGLSDVRQGDKGGREGVVLTQQNMPQLVGPSDRAATEAMDGSGQMLTDVVPGGSAPVTTMDPWIGLRYCVVTTGVFPSRS